MRNCFSVVTIALLSCTTIHAQTVQEVQNKILNSVRQLDKWDPYKEDIEQDDSLGAINKRLLNYLVSVCTNNTSLLKGDFTLPKDIGVNILTSDDRRFRIYCWNVRGGGTAQSFDDIIQYKSGNTTRVKILNDDSKAQEGETCTGSYYSDLYTIKTKDHKIVYVPIGHYIFSSTVGTNEISAYYIKNSKLVTPYTFFKTNIKTTSSIDVEYDYSSTQNRDQNTDIEMEENKKELWVPNSEITNQYFIYEFDGYKFTFDKKRGGIGGVDY